MMRRSILFFFLSIVLFSCSKDDNQPTPPVVIPDIISGPVNELNFTPIDIATPDKGSLTVEMNSVAYKVQFAVVDQAQSNAVLSLASDTILSTASREYTNLGKDAIGYQPLADNEVTVYFKDGRKVTGQFDQVSAFSGSFGEQLISQWRLAGDPTRPNQKAKDDIRNFVALYRDKDGAGPGSEPLYLQATVSKL
jgi:hypothetical protein